jgi:hypothetical protein
MAKAKPTKAPPSKKARPSAKKGSSMFKWILFVAVVAGLGYAAYTVPVQGKTVFARAADASPWTVEIKRRTPAEKVARDGLPAETITAAERESLDRLVRR